MDKTNGLPVQNGIDADVKDFRYVHHLLIINQSHLTFFFLKIFHAVVKKPLTH